MNLQSIHRFFADNLQYTYWRHIYTKDDNQAQSKSEVWPKDIFHNQSFFQIQQEELLAMSCVQEAALHSQGVKDVENLICDKTIDRITSVHDLLR